VENVVRTLCADAGVWMANMHNGAEMGRLKGRRNTDRSMSRRESRVRVVLNRLI
jgi:hypothetical protein